MYTYSIEKHINSNKKKFLSLYDNYFQEKAVQMRSLEGKVYSVCAKFNDQIVGVMGVMKFDVDANINVQEGHWQFYHLVVHPDHRSKGLANGIIRMSIKFLIELGAKTIRNHKRSNTISHEIFTELQFKLIKFDDTKPLYKWNYELKVDEVDMDKLKEIWKQYKE